MIKKLILLMTLSTTALADPGLSATPKGANCTRGDNCNLYAQYSFSTVNETDTPQMWDVWYDISPSVGKIKRFHKQLYVPAHTTRVDTHWNGLDVKFGYAAHYYNIATVIASCNGKSYSVENKADVYVSL